MSWRWCMLIENRKNFYTVMCMEWNVLTGGLIIHKEVNVGSVAEGYEYMLKHLYEFPTGTWIFKPYLTAIM